MKKWFKEENFRKLATKKNAILALLGVFIFAQFVRTELALNQYRQLANRDSSLVAEIGQIKDSYGLMGNNLNEVREFLRLPTGNFVAFSDDETEEKSQNTMQLALFEYVNFLAESKRIEEKLTRNQNALENVVESEALAQKAAEKNLSASELTDNGQLTTFNIGNEASPELISLQLEKESGKLMMVTDLGEEEIKIADPAELEELLVGFVDQHTETLIKGKQALAEAQAKLISALETGEVAEILENRGLEIDTEFPAQNGRKLSYFVNNKSSEAVGEIQLETIELTVKLEDLRNPKNSVLATNLSAQLPFFLNQLDNTTYIERKAAQALETVKSTFADAGFQLLLKENGMSIAQTIREDDERYYFDLFDGETLIGSVVVEKATGVVNIVDENGANGQNILFFDPEVKKKTLDLPENIPDYGGELVDNDGTFTVLIAGKHGSLVDTMIVAHASDARQDIRMISIPRDLKYNGRKINAYPSYYGMDELVKVLNEVTGYKIDRYILIDMYAFIDVIDLIGGIDITLESAVIDPFYRTVDNGVVGTLHYEPGDYHLGGVEALRLARSRKTSSDFARAERQQMILEAIQNKARNFGFGDADTLYLIAKTVLDKTETNIGLDEAIRHYFRYQNYQIKSNDVMSSGNVLYSPPYVSKEQCEAESAQVDPNSGQPVAASALCAAGEHAYTLLPRNDDWDVIKWFFREKFE